MASYLSKMKKNLRGLGLLLFTVATSFSSYSQVLIEEDELDIILDDLFFNEALFIDEILDSFNTYNFIYTNISYNSNTYFSGRDSGIDQYNIIPQLTYYNSSGFNMSISGIYYSKFDPNWDFTNISVGYYNTLGKEKSFHYNVGYTRFFYSDGWDTFTNSLDLSVGIRNNKRTIGTKLEGSFLFGNDESFQLISRSYGNITLTRQNNFVIKFIPELNFIIAQQTIALEQIIDEGDETNTEIINYDVFELLNTQINLPISLTTKSWDFELGYTINLPSEVEGESNLNTTSFFHLSIGYLIDLSKK